MDIDLPRPFIPPDNEWVPVTVQDPKTVVIGGRTYFNVHFDAADIENDSENTEESDATNEEDKEQPDRKSDTDDFSDEESSEDEYACSDHPTRPYFFTAEDLEEEKKIRAQKRKEQRHKKFHLSSSRIQMLETELFAEHQPTVTSAERLTAPVTETQKKASKPRPKRKPKKAIRGHQFVETLSENLEKLCNCPFACFDEDELQDEDMQIDIFRTYGTFFRKSIKEKDQEIKQLIIANVKPQSGERSPRGERMVNWNGRQICVPCWCRIHGVGLSTYYTKRN